MAKRSKGRKGYKSWVKVLALVLLLFMTDYELSTGGSSLVVDVLNQLGIGSHQTQSVSGGSVSVGGSVSSTEAQSGSPVSLVGDWDYEAYPLYYRSLGGAPIDTSLFPQAGFITYSALDGLGRAGIVRGSITNAMYERSIGSKQTFDKSDMPIGFWDASSRGRKTWNSILGKQDMVDFDGRVYRSWFYNKSHMVGDALGGEEIRENLVTATLFQNVGSRKGNGGMRYPESRVESYFKENGIMSGVVYYEVIPNYIDDELLPRTVTVNFLSDDGSLDESVLVSNSANGYAINYKTGEFIKE